MLGLNKFFKFHDLIWRIVICVIFSSCSNQIKSEKEIAFSKLFPDVSFNKEIQQIVVRNEINQKIGQSIFLRLENLSSSTIVFPTDYGVKILTYSNDRKLWKEIMNEGVYLPPDSHPVLKPYNEDGLRFLGIPLSPVLEDTSDEISVRIVVIGTVYEDDQATDKLLGSYTDLTLSP
jgi:hypothetical protein